MKRTFRTLEEMRRLVAVARGDAPPDLLITGGKILNVYSGEVLPGLVATAGGRIAYVGNGRLFPGPDTSLIDARGAVLAPGYLDPHTHPQIMVTPDEFARSVLPLGTTGVVADTLHLLYLTQPHQTPKVLGALADLPFHFLWFLRLHGQAHTAADAAAFEPGRLAMLQSRDDVRAVGEVTRWPLAYTGDEGTLQGIAEGLSRGQRIEGHAPGVSSDRLQALVAAGFSADHEAITAEQALDRLRAGLYVMLRHGSLRRDLPALAPVITRARVASGRLMLTLDGPSTPFIHKHGYVDHVLDVAMQVGIDPIAAYQMATLNPASYFGLDEELGGLAAGRQADVLLLEDLGRPRPRTVIVRGTIVARDGRLITDIAQLPWERWVPPLTQDAWRPDPSVFSLDGLPARVPAMHLESTVIATRRDIPLASELPPGVLRLVLLDPAGRWRCRTLLSGFCDHLAGLATSWSSSTGVYVMGTDPTDMAAAATRVLELGGGIVWIEDGATRFELPLPLGGVMSPRPLAEIATAVDVLTGLLRERGYSHGDLTYSLLFLNFDSLPYIRLTYEGLWDVVEGRVILPREDL